MAGTTNKTTNTKKQEEFNPYLSPTQQDLLIAALASSNPSGKGSTYPPAVTAKKGTNNPVENLNMNDVNTSYFTSPEQPTPGSGTFGSVGMEDSPFIDYLEPDSNFDLEPIDDDDMIGALPGGPPASEQDGDLHEKRKSISDNVDDEEGGGKRRESEDKAAKKPGRKPLTSEPTTKRKAQNRAAQRAFRERKEKHLKDLETKVNELEKESETKNHENGLLRAQVARLQIELREYRKRLSLNSTGLNRSPTVGAVPSFLQQKKTTNTSPGFEFEFPRFGGLPGSQIFNNSALAKDQNKASHPVRSSSTPQPNSKGGGILSRHDSTGRSLSPKGQTLGNGTTTRSPALSNGMNSNGMQNPPHAGGIDDLASLFSPSILKADNPFDHAIPSNPYRDSQQDNSSENSVGQTDRVFRFNSTQSNATTSPSDSSTSQYNATSSAGTSPEPSLNSPENTKSNDIITGDATTGGYICHGNSEGEVAFCESLNMACGNPRNPVPRAKSLSNGTPAFPTPIDLNVSMATNATAPTPAKSPAAEVNGIDWLANQNGGGFDPVLFGDYRESQDAIVGGGEFTGGFFSDAFGLPELGSPSTFVQDHAAQNNLMSEIEKAQNGMDDEEMVPGDDPSQMLNCNNIWNQLQNRSDFQEGSLDIEGLCSELRAKARCSETGVVVDRKDVDAALKNLPQKA
ncbi:MAG: DNA-binding transcription factor yap1 [Bathelium mastoideum]|nr:MAG: DNA-binding transcription factor yap1 [Bathelium mastoideum]